MSLSSPIPESEYPILLDGGLSNQLEDQGFDLDHDLWSAKLLNENPQAIIDAHLAYLKAGARILITSSYQASIQGLQKAGFSEQKSIELILLSVELAREAIIRFKNDSNSINNVWTAASIGPYGAFLADGSEYSGNYDISTAELIDFHLKNIEILSMSSADFLACETIPSKAEAEVLNDLLKIAKKPAWITLSCQNGSQLNDGSSFKDVIRMFESNPNIFAVGVNCTKPEYISELIELIKVGAPSKRIVVYPNSGEVYNPETKSWAGLNDPMICALQSQQWLDLGADIIGGCCRMGPQHIQTIGTVIESRK